MQGKLRNNKGIGDRGEEIAARYLKEHGFRIIARNVRYKSGEIDIVAGRGRELHFVEVRTRTDPDFLPPVETVTARKQGRIRSAAGIFLEENGKKIKDVHLTPCYFSVIGVDLSGAKPEIECIFDAFV